MNYLEVLKKAKHGQKIRRKCWNKGDWHGGIEEDYDGVRVIFNPWNIGTYFGNLLAEDWEIVEEKPKLFTKEEKKLIEYHARLICLRDFDKLQIDFMKEAIDPKYHEITIKLAEVLNRATENFWRNVEIPT